MPSINSYKQTRVGCGGVDGVPENVKVPVIDVLGAASYRVQVYSVLGGAQYNRLVYSVTWVLVTVMALMVLRRDGWRLVGRPAVL
ncbi:uncharacterized protein G2W53_016997 [Senna tora]|uniref:Uncharacterized protein n=1 Tax=Senna tora TaxID=362788 RepID=A0A834TP37_9FABA|nr:uncharacterized protein G2W53_016997 [Senna tora]